MKVTLVFFCSFLYLQLTISQDIIVNKLRSETSRTIKKEADTSHWNWKSGGLMSFNLAQGSLSNWASGGDNFTMSMNGYCNYFFFYKKDRHCWDNNLDVNLGYLQSTSLGIRKNDDHIDYLSKYGYKIDSLGVWYLSGLFNFRSQFFDGYNFSNNVGELSSSFLSPAYLIVSPGFDYKPSAQLSLFLSPLTYRLTYVGNNYLSQKGSYGIPKGEHSINQFGTFITINYDNIIAKNIYYKGRLDLFSNYNNGPQNVDFYMTNLFSFRINKNFSARYSLDLIYDDDIRIFGPTNTSPGLQVKSLIGIGYQKPFALKRINYS